MSQHVLYRQACYTITYIVSSAHHIITHVNLLTTGGGGLFSFVTATKDWGERNSVEAGGEGLLSEGAKT